MKTTIGTYTLILNEARWVAAHLISTLPHIDQAVFFDGGSTDGTLEIIKAISKDFPGKIKLFEGKDPANLQEDYVRLSNECMWSLDTDLAWFLHPDMYVTEWPKDFSHLADAVSAFVSIDSFAGNPDGPLYRIKGRGEKWKSIYRLRNPNLGAHYWGHYGHVAEDTYFSEITGDRHHHYGPDFKHYPYSVVDSGIGLNHYSDVRTPRRRYERMVKCLLNNGHTVSRAERLALDHPRVTLKDGEEFSFEPALYPDEFNAAYLKYCHLRKEVVTA